MDGGHYPDASIWAIVFSSSNRSAIFVAGTHAGAGVGDLIQADWPRGLGEDPVLKVLRASVRLDTGHFPHQNDSYWILLNSLDGDERIASVLRWSPWNDSLDQEYELYLPIDKSGFGHSAARLCGFWNGTIFVAQSELWKIDSLSGRVVQSHLMSNLGDQSCSVADRNIVILAPTLTVIDAASGGVWNGPAFGQAEFSSFDDSHVLIWGSFGVSLFSVVEKRFAKSVETNPSIFKCTSLFISDQCV
jgi:hypothetical protein